MEKTEAEKYGPAGAFYQKDPMGGKRKLASGLKKRERDKEMRSQKLREWLSKNFVLQGLVVFQGRRHTSGMSRS